MTSKEDTLKVPKLQADGSNWITYKDRLRWALDARNVLHHLETDVPEPEVKTAEEVAAGAPLKAPAKPKKGNDDAQASDTPEGSTPVANSGVT